MITVCGEKITIEALRKIIPVTPENAGSRWKPIPHGELADTIRDEVLTRGWQVDTELYTTSRGGADMAGALMLSKVSGFNMPDMSLSLGFLNSNARRKALQLTVGASVFCCTNGMCTGTIVMKRVHDHTIDIVEAAVDRYQKAALEVPLVVERLRQCEISPATASEILMETGRRGLIGWAAVGRVDKEYRNPTFGEHGKNTSWALMNAFTYAARPNIAPVNQMEAYNEFRAMLPTA